MAIANGGSSRVTFNRRRDAAALRAHTMSGWLNVEATKIPDIAGAERLVWCGIGGSMLPTRAIVDAFASAERKNAFVPLDSPEPNGYALSKSDQLVFASKSGKTLELWTWISRLSADRTLDSLERAPLVVTEDTDNPLARWARSRGYPISPIPVRVGGRFSAFTGIGTVPLAWLGRDVDAFLAGASAVATSLENGEHPMIRRVDEFGARWLEEADRGISEWVFIPYASRLALVADFWVQLVAESLGKQTADGVRHGFTPIRSVGPIDQHSQLQRWIAGPRNLGVLALTAREDIDETLAPPAECPFAGLASLTGSRILAAQAAGTVEALAAAGVPTVAWDLDRLDERMVGELLMGLHVLVGLTGIALGLDPFDQPAVEDGKKRTLRMLGLG